MRKVTFGTLLFLCVSATAVGQESKPVGDRVDLSRLAQQAFDDQKWDEAATHYRALVKLDEKDAVAWHHLGYALHSLARQYPWRTLKFHGTVKPREERPALRLRVGRCGVRGRRGS